MPENAAQRQRKHNNRRGAVERLQLGEISVHRAASPANRAEKFIAASGLGGIGTRTQRNRTKSKILIHKARGPCARFDSVPWPPIAACMCRVLPSRVMPPPLLLDLGDQRRQRLLRFPPASPGPTAPAARRSRADPMQREAHHQEVPRRESRRGSSSRCFCELPVSAETARSRRALASPRPWSSGSARANRGIFCHDSNKPNFLGGNGQKCLVAPNPAGGTFVRHGEEEKGGTEQVRVSGADAGPGRAAEAAARGERASTPSAGFAAFLGIDRRSAGTISRMVPLSREIAFRLVQRVPA
jgi:hypothetical protein